MLRIFIGLDPRQPVAYTVLQSSIIRRASKPVAISPLVLKTLPIKRKGLTEFTYSRFLVPWLCDFRGAALFLDADMLALGDIAELFANQDLDAAVGVVQNKLRFEWPSLMLFNCALCTDLTPAVVDNESFDPFKWVYANAGGLDPAWNHCVGYDLPNPNAKLAHFTQGIPCFPETADSEFAEEWKDESLKCRMTVSWKAIMGNSVHAAPVLNRLEQQMMKAAKV